MEREVPLHELLKSVPENARLVIDSEDGLSTRYIPVGNLCKKASEALTKPKWVGLTDEEVEAWRGNYDFFDSALVREVETKLKEKNT